MVIGDFLSYGDIVNVVLIEEAFPFVRDADEDRGNRHRNGLQGRVFFADGSGLLVYSHGGRCMPLFEEDSIKIEDSDFAGNVGTFFPWSSVISVLKVTDSRQYEMRWQEHERDQDAFYRANGSWAASSREFFSWRNSLSPAEHRAAYDAPSVDDEPQ